MGPNTILCSGVSLTPALSIFDAITGTSVRASAVDTIMMMLTIHPSWRNIIPAMPDTMVRGRNTQRVVRVEPIIEPATSDVPFTAASLRFSPRSMWREMFSSTTIELSTTMPMAMERALMEMMLSVFPVARRYTSEPIRAMGMASTMMKVARQRPRKMNTTSITTSMVMIMVLRSDLMVLMILSDESITSTSSISEGSVGAISAIFFFTWRMTSTVFAPDCFCTRIVAACLPSVQDSWYFSAGPSTSVATSRRYTAAPPL